MRVLYIVNVEPAEAGSKDITPPTIIVVTSS